MIINLTGKIKYSNTNYVIINVSNIGYKVFVSNDTLSKINKETKDIMLWTFQVVRETALDLYGFLSKEDLDLFELLISVSGIGPKSALGIFNVATTDSLISAISTGDTSYLTKVSGIGSKSAQKIVLELGDKIKKINQTPEGIKGEVDVIEALVSLGYSIKQAGDALQKIEKNGNTKDMVKKALKMLAK